MLGVCDGAQAAAGGLCAEDGGQAGGSESGSGACRKRFLRRRVTRKGPIQRSTKAAMQCKLSFPQASSRMRKPGPGGWATTTRMGDTVRSMACLDCHRGGCSAGVPSAAASSLGAARFALHLDGMRPSARPSEEPPLSAHAAVATLEVHAAAISSISPSDV